MGKNRREEKIENSLLKPHVFPFREKLPKTCLSLKREGRVAFQKEMFFSKKFNPNFYFFVVEMCVHEHECLCVCVSVCLHLDGVETYR